MSEDRPAQAVTRDAEDEKAPNPRRHYDSPEELREDVNLNPAAREDLLKEWKHDLDRRLEAESEGMSASDPISQEREARLASELRRVCAALDDLVAERGKAAGL